MSYWGCEVRGCTAHPKNGDVIYRTSEKGEPFRGRCARHMEDRLDGDGRDSRDPSRSRLEFEM